MKPIEVLIQLVNTVEATGGLIDFEDGTTAPRSRPRLDRPGRCRVESLRRSAAQSRTETTEAHPHSPS